MIWIQSSVLPIQYPLTLTRTQVKTSAIQSLVESVSNFSASLLDLNTSEITVISSLRRNIVLVETFMADLYYFAELVYHCTLENQTLKSTAVDVMFAFNSTIVQEYHGPNDPLVHGLAIYFTTGSGSHTRFPGYQSASTEYEFNKIYFLSDTLWNEFLTYYLSKAPVFAPSLISYINIEVGQERLVNNPLKNDPIFYALLITQSGIYHFSLAIIQGDVQMYVSSKEGATNGLSIPLLLRLKTQIN